MSESVEVKDQSGDASLSENQGVALRESEAPPSASLDHSTFAIERPPALVSRTSFLERLGQKLLERRRPIVNSIGIAVTTLFLMAASVMAWRFYAEWRQGRIELTTDGAPLVCQVIAETSDEPVGEPFDLVTRAVVALPAGEYRLRANGMGRLGRTYRFSVNRGETQAHSISIDEGRLLGGERMPELGNRKPQREVPIPFAPVSAALELTPGKADLIEWSAKSLICRDGVTAKVNWDAFNPAKPFEHHRDPKHWMRNLSAAHHLGKLIEPALDLDGDGTRDLLWSFPNESAFLALAGKDGSILWNYVAELDGPGGPKPDGPESRTRAKAAQRNSSLIGTPAMADVDRDGTPDLIATIIFSETPAETERRPAATTAGAAAGNKRPLYRRVITAVSGRSGRWLWSYPVDLTFVNPPQHAWKRPATLVQGRPSSLIAIVDDTKWLGLDLPTGKPRSQPIDLGNSLIRPLQYSDLDGDDQPEILALSPGPAGGQRTLHVYSIKTGQELWTDTTGAAYDQSENGGPPPGFPLLADLDGDGRSEIVVPDSGAMPPLSGYRGLKLLDGARGTTRWRTPMRPDTKSGDGLTESIAAPDLDGDGTRDLVTVSLFEGKNPTPNPQTSPEEPERVYVDAISGKDGRLLWWWSVDLPVERFTRIWKPAWWGRGPDGWPLLAVPMGGAHPDGFEGNLPFSLLTPPVVHLLEASTGRERHTVLGLTKARMADLNGDGLADLWGEFDGELRAFRGEAPEAWRALGQFHAANEQNGRIDKLESAGIDFDGDGVCDTLIAGVRTPGGSARQTTGSHTALARSGRDGHIIWKTVLDARESWLAPSRGDSYGLTSFSLPAGDLDGDGTADLVAQKFIGQLPGQVNRRAATLPLQVFSGRTGRALWSAGPLPLGFDAHGYSQVSWIEARSVEPGGAPDLLVSHGNPFTKAGSAPSPAATPGRPSLARISGRDGRIVWDVSLAEGALPQIYQYVPPPQFADLNGDGGLDILLVLPPIQSAGQPDFTLVAVSLRDGKQLWSQALKFHANLVSEIRVGDLDGDRRPDVVVMEELLVGNEIELEAQAFDGRDGKARWTWKSGRIFQDNLPSRLIALADLEGNGAQKVYLSFKEPRGLRRVLVLDEAGKEVAHRDVTGDHFSVLTAMDLNGDRRDELLVAYDQRLHAWGRDLNELWSWPSKSTTIEQVIPASPGQPGAVLIHPALALDGATGQPRWTGQSPVVYWPPSVAPKLLGPGDSARRALLIGNNGASTVCRVAMPTTPQGTIAVARGTPVRRDRIEDDPRWTRALPWSAWLKGPFGASGLLAASGLALFNVILPLLIIRLLAGRRRFSIRALMALPIAAAVPLMMYIALEPVLPVESTPLLSSEKRLFIAGTAAGLPIVLSLVLVARSLARGRMEAARRPGTAHHAELSRHRGRLAPVRHEIDVVDRALRPCGMVSSDLAGRLHSLSAHADRLVNPGRLPASEAVSREFAVGWVKPALCR